MESQCISDRLCISQRDGLHAVLFPRIDNLIDQGLDLAIQADL